jgi:hypothetical protein
MNFAMGASIGEPVIGLASIDATGHRHFPKHVLHVLASLACNRR